MTYEQCTTDATRLCLQVWMLDSPIISSILGLIVAVFIIKFVIKFIPFIG